MMQSRLTCRNSPDSRLTEASEQSHTGHNGLIGGWHGYLTNVRIFAWIGIPWPKFDRPGLNTAVYVGPRLLPSP